MTEITYNALTLVQDPFGNYVVRESRSSFTVVILAGETDIHVRHGHIEYVLDLNDVRFSEALIRQFIGNVCALSVQKFSSNVVEKVNL